MSCCIESTSCDRSRPRSRLNGRTILASQLAYIQAHGTIPIGMCVCHKCDNPRCVNPEHLFLGTRTDNNKDRTQKGRSAKGESHGRAILTEDIVVAARAMKRSGIAGFKIIEHFHAPVQGMRKALRGETWKHLLLGPEKAGKNP